MRAPFFANRKLLTYKVDQMRRGHGNKCPRKFARNPERSVFFRRSILHIVRYHNEEKYIAIQWIALNGSVEIMNENPEQFGKNYQISNTQIFKALRNTVQNGCVKNVV